MSSSTLPSGSCLLDASHIHKADGIQLGDEAGQETKVQCTANTKDRTVSSTASVRSCCTKGGPEKCRARYEGMLNTYLHQAHNVFDRLRLEGYQPEQTCVAVIQSRETSAKLEYNTETVALDEEKHQIKTVEELNKMMSTITPKQNLETTESHGSLK